MTVRVWGELVPCNEFIETTHPEKMKELWVRVKYSPCLRDLIESRIDFKGYYSHHLYLQLIEDPTKIFEYDDVMDFIMHMKDYEENQH